jgi:hypothetical protein
MKQKTDYDTLFNSFGQLSSPNGNSLHKNETLRQGFLQSMGSVNDLDSFAHDHDSPGLPSALPHISKDSKNFSLLKKN